MFTLSIYNLNSWPRNPTNNFKFNNCLFEQVI